MVTDWDALGYYMYLPGLFIYNDLAQLNWMDSIDKKYAVTGGELYQAGKQDNGKYVFKYLGGIAILQSPFFLVGHFIAKNTGYPADGFSRPYQQAIAVAAILYCLLGIFILRKVLLLYFDDKVTAITLLLLCLATNLIQYVSVNGGMSHAYIFPLYAAVLYVTIQWHRRPGVVWAALAGYIIGLAIISRPTEAVMIFIPLLWDTHTRAAAKEKWQAVRRHKMQVVIAVLFGLLGVLPQLLYWKAVTGSFVYDVGSKWSFLNPFLRVLFGWEKGWFIYTPVTLFFVTGVFFVKKYPFKNSAIWFCLLNIYIIISWYDWRYGASYSTRALVQSYPVFALPFAAFIQKVHSGKWRIPLYLCGAYLIAVNIFQVWQYNSGILHYNDMNRQYYGRIYLDAHPTPLDMSLLDTDEWLGSEEGYNKKQFIIEGKQVHSPSGSHDGLVEIQLPGNRIKWIKLECRMKMISGLWESYLHTEIINKDSVKHTRIRLSNALSKDGKLNGYAFYMKVPEGYNNGALKIYLASNRDIDAWIEKLVITTLEK